MEGFEVLPTALAYTKRLVPVSLIADITLQVPW